MHICQICKKAPATIHLTDIHNNVKKEMHLCESCAAEKGFNMQTAANIPQLLGLAAKKKAELLKQRPARNDEDDLACPACGFKWSDFQAKGRLGCPNDYAAFGTRMKELVASQLMHTTLSGSESFHMGKTPPGVPPASDATRAARRNLDLRLRRAVAAEQYEEAARIKGEIDAMKKGGDETPGE